MKHRHKTEDVRYDAVLKDLFQQDHPALLDQLTGGVNVRESLNVEFARVDERRADLVLLLEDETIFHLDFQSGNDKDMPYRQGMYGLMIAHKYRRKVRQAVLYTGPGKLRMADRLDTGDIKVWYRLMDIRELDAAVLLRSGRPGDCVLALLAKGGDARFREILRKANGLPAGQRERSLAQLAVLSGLRRLAGKVKMELKRMRATIDIEKHAILREIRDTCIAEGEAKGEAKGRVHMLMDLLTLKFGPLPKWTRQRLEKATPEQVQLWSKRILSANTLEGVLGKR